MSQLKSTSSPLPESTLYGGVGDYLNGLQVNDRRVVCTAMLRLLGEFRALSMEDGEQLKAAAKMEQAVRSLLPDAQQTALPVRAPMTPPDQITPD